MYISRLQSTICVPFSRYSVLSTYWTPIGMYAAIQGKSCWSASIVLSYNRWIFVGCMSLIKWLLESSHSGWLPLFGRYKDLHKLGILNGEVCIRHWINQRLILLYRVCIARKFGRPGRQFLILIFVYFICVTTHVSSLLNKCRETNALSVVFDTYEDYLNLSPEFSCHISEATERGFHLYPSFTMRFALQFEAVCSVSIVHQGPTSFSIASIICNYHTECRNLCQRCFQQACREPCPNLHHTDVNDLILKHISTLCCFYVSIKFGIDLLPDWQVVFGAMNMWALQ